MDAPDQEFKARPYQICLYEKAIHQNSILYLPTGTGKTFIAVLLAKHMSYALTKPFSEGGKRTFFIVNTVALVHQQSAFFSRHTGLTCKGYSGDMQVDFWSRDQWIEELETNQILVMTAQIFLNILNPGWVTLDQINLLIFDECHKAVKEHPMRQIMQRFEGFPQSQKPRILAMSASLLNSNVKIEKIEQTLKELEITFDASILTVDALESVKAYATDPKEFIEYYKPAPKSSVVDKIKLLIGYAEEVLKHLKLPEKMDHSASSPEFRPDSKNIKLRRILDDTLEHIDDAGMYGGSLSVLLHMIQLEKIKKSSDDQESIIALDFLITQLMKIRHLLESEMDESNPCQAVMEHSSPKVLKLLEVLLNFKTNLKANQKFCCIIFVQRRFTAKVLYHILKKLSSANENFNFLKPEYMVGYNNDPYRNPREQLCLTKWNKEVLAKFRNGTANCVVATDVVDEGVDIPSCTLVIRYYAPQDFRAYIQSKGRARHSTSHYIILAPDSQYMSRHQSYKTTEQYLHSALHGKSDLRSKPTDEEIDDILYSRDIEPYSILKEDGTRSVITEQTAVSLINIYCASLLKSKFIMLAPAWVKSEIQTSGALLYQVSLTLPPISPVRDTVIGNAFDSLDIAKRSAAMKACIKLHHLGEFDDNLLPKRVEDVLKNTDYLFPFMEEEEEQVPGACPGTASKKRRHPLYYPEALSAGLPREGDSVNYLHIIRMRPTYPKPDESRHVVFYNLLDDGATFGILSTKKFPSIPSFPIYMNVGELQIGLDVNIEVPHLMQSQIELLKKFHFTIFTDVVPVLKDFMLFDRENVENCYLVCPVNAQSKIDWESIEKYQSVSTVTPEKPLKVTSSEYEMALVRPTYRASHVYVVTSVCEYLFASSSFPTRDFKSYTHYYKERHDIEIEDENQPLLEVKPISKKINCIKPRHITGQISRRKRANLTEDFEEHLVPELCEILNFPSVYWLKGTTLPSILHRITQLLTAEEFRVTISHEAGLNLTTPEAGRQWEPVSIEMSGEQTSSVADSTLDESAIDEEMDTSCVLTRDECLEVDVLSEEHGLYSWSRKEEPCDLERLADTVQLIDIEYYHKFMCNSSSADVKSLKLQNKIKSNYKKVTSVPVPEIKMLNRTNPYGPSPADILQNCLTAKSAHDAFNFERSETLGDSFLKFATSLFLFHQYQMYEEGPLTFLKGKIVGNLNLYRCGTQKNLAGRMNFEEFNANGNFVTPAYIVDRVMRNLIFDLEISPSILYEISIPTVEKFYGMMSSITRDAVQDKFLSWTSEQATQATGLEHFLGVQVIPDKSVADCVEAVIGTYLLHVGVEGALNIVKWFQILPKTLDMHGLLYGDIPNPRLGVGEIDKLMPWADAIESRIGYKFKNRALLLQAFTHPSFLENRITGSYQRLEFLGDAILDFLLTAHIYETCGNLDPGELTDLRSALVNNITFACLAVRYGLNTALLSHAPKLFEAIDRFVKFQEERDYEVNDELLWILLEEEECRISEHVDVPKALGDIFESVIGAIFLDLKKDLQKTWQVIYCLMKKEIDLFSRNVPKQPIRVIHETPGAHPKFSVAEKVETSSTMMVTLSVIINGKRKYFHGFGTTKKLAKCAASKLALKHLRHKRE